MVSGKRKYLQNKLKHKFGYNITRTGRGKGVVFTKHFSFKSNDIPYTGDLIVSAVQSDFTSEDKRDEAIGICICNKARGKDKPLNVAATHLSLDELETIYKIMYRLKEEIDLEDD